MIYLGIYLFIGLIFASTASVVIKTDCQDILHHTNGVRRFSVCVATLLIVLVTWPVWLGFFLRRFLK